MEITEAEAMKKTQMSIVVVDDQGQITLPSWVRQRCDLRPGDCLLIGQMCGISPGLFYGAGLILISSSALGRHLRQWQEDLKPIAEVASTPAISDALLD
ncbi:AbrB/MazE/SpoVT family DNA-binding domain-containing protein [Capsulimonas corticalis]|uniref:AbrB/MazE/SpoVT family DNA-binding domain-containing protein n=1 Tax=Capsulimonas corticalis TaxID=2219043 RepID=UPI000F650396|nr:AbrB/MazE/SpoVT family DNA-binding domain-containing protein [Capsulimonas corticalis]